MLETRLPISTLPATLPRGHARTAPARERRAPTRTATDFARPERAAAPIAAPRPKTRQAIIHSRLARSEARMLALAITATALMCAVLVIYLAAYAHVTQLGLEQDMAKRQLARLSLQNQHLQVDLTKLQDRARIVSAARALHMVPYTGPAVYVYASGGGPQVNTQIDPRRATDAAPASDGVASGDH